MPRSTPRASPRGAITCPTRCAISTRSTGRPSAGRARPARCCSIPAPEQPTAPNAGILRLEPGAHHPEHYHGFAQVWFILKGEFTIDGRLCPPGTMLYHPDPHFEGEFHTATGGEILIVQYPGPSTGERPIYAGRFNMEKRKAVDEERVDL